MDKFEQPIGAGEKLNLIEQKISELESSSVLTLADFQQAEKELNEIQKGLEADDLRPFEDRMKALAERVKEQE